MTVQLLLLLLGFLLVRRIPAESPSCLAVYREGGAPAVFQSPKCPRWTLPASAAPHINPNCHLAIHQGRRRSQEDRAVCALDIRIPFLVKGGIKEVGVDIAAIFDGHNGAEASDMASRLLLQYFLLHVYFLLDGVYSTAAARPAERLVHEGEDSLMSGALNVQHSWHRFDPERSKWTLPTVLDDAFHMELLKESLLRTIHDIDATFSEEASRKDLESGSTATVVLIADDQILAANVGDSKAIMCSEHFHSTHVPKGNRSKLSRRRKRERRQSVVSTVQEIENFKLANLDGEVYYVKELTMDHHPDRDDERNRVEAAGGYVEEWAGVLRVNGELAVSRAVGDIPFKNYGVISTPEVTDWQCLSSNDSYLVAASDGIFEKMTTQEVCDALWDEKIKANVRSKFIPTITHSLADCIIENAIERGTMDNMAIIVLPLGSASISRTFMTHDYKDGTYTPPFFRQRQVMQNELGDDSAPKSLIPMDYFNQMMSKFNRLLVKTKYNASGCFYLSENLSESTNIIFRAAEHYQRDEVHGLYHALPESLGSYNDGGLLDLYSDKNTCWHSGIHDGDKGHCTSPEYFVKFLGLLDSVPYIDAGSNSSKSFGYKFPDFRYMLKKRFDRGSFGEVWLAFHWNCSQDIDLSNEMGKKLPRSCSSLHFSQCKCNTSMHSGSSNTQCFDDPNCDNIFILKRIMVERGNSAYLSGLREKYFGEVFQNASISVGGFQGTRLSAECSMEVQHDASVGLQNTSYLDKMNYYFDPVDSFSKKSSNCIISGEEGLKHIARFVESFESESNEIWLVFQNEGLSLSKLIYNAEETKFVPDGETVEHTRNLLVVHPSSWWHWLRTTDVGRKEMQNLIRQLLLAIKSCHDRNITHRDIKPENMIICFEDMDTGKCLKETTNLEKHYRLKMRLIDFGSAIDGFTLKHLYGSGPTRSEQTYEYTPPEALLNASWFQGPTSVTMKYDMWSVGVVILELIFGSPQVFQISDRTRTILDQYLEGWSEQIKELAFKVECGQLRGNALKKPFHSK